MQLRQCRHRLHPYRITRIGLIHQQSIIWRYARTKAAAYFLYLIFLFICKIDHHRNVICISQPVRHLPVPVVPLLIRYTFPDRDLFPVSHLVLLSSNIFFTDGAFFVSFFMLTSSSFLFAVLR